MIKVVFFAALREKLDCGEVSIDPQDLSTVADVKQALLNMHPDWQAHLTNGSLLSAVNSDMVSEQHPVQSGDEVAFFPPVTGG